jgi:hypothetical protein
MWNVTSAPGHLPEWSCDEVFHVERHLGTLVICLRWSCDEMFHVEHKPWNFIPVGQ